MKPVIIGKAELWNVDCMLYMATLPDKAFSLAICDPPYGLNMAKERPRKDGRFAHNVPRTWMKKYQIARILMN